MKNFDARPGDLVVTTKSLRWKPPFDLVRVATVDADGVATSFRSLDGRLQHQRLDCESCFLFVCSPERLHAAQAVVREGTSFLAVQTLLRPLRDEAWYVEHQPVS